MTDSCSLTHDPVHAPAPKAKRLPLGMELTATVYFTNGELDLTTKVVTKHFPGPDAFGQNHIDNLLVGFTALDGCLWRVMTDDEIAEYKLAQEKTDGA